MAIALPDAACRLGAVMVKTAVVGLRPCASGQTTVTRKVIDCAARRQVKITARNKETITRLIQPPNIRFSWSQIKADYAYAVSFCQPIKWYRAVHSSLPISLYLHSLRPQGLVGLGGGGGGGTAGAALAFAAGAMNLPPLTDSAPWRPPAELMVRPAAIILSRERGASL